MGISRQFAIKAQHELMRYHAMRVVKIESGYIPPASDDAYRKRVAYWLTIFHQLHVN